MSSTSDRMEFCDKASVKFVEHWMQSTFNPKQNDRGYDGSGTWPECPRKVWWGKSCQLHPGYKRSRCRPRPCDLITTTILLGPLLLWSYSRSAVSEIMEKGEEFRVFLRLLSTRSFPEEKLIWRWMNDFITKFSKLREVTFSYKLKMCVAISMYISDKYGRFCHKCDFFL